MSSIDSEHFKTAVLDLLDETFDNVQGYYLDKDTSLFQTLESISAEEASIPVGGQCATLAAQVKHVAFYLDVIEKSFYDPDFPKADWDEIWQTVKKVTPAEWQVIQDELRLNYNRILDMIKSAPSWPSDAEIGDAISAIVHTAYHLGEIRQALCILRA